MKSSSWGGSVLLLLALILVFVVDRTPEPRSGSISRSALSPNSLAVHVGVAGEPWGFLDPFNQAVSDMMIRDLGVTNGNVTVPGSSYSSTPFGATMSNSVLCTGIQVDREVLETVLLGIAVDRLEWVDDSRAVVVGYQAVDAGGISLERDLVLVDGVHRWVDA